MLNTLAFFKNGSNQSQSSINSIDVIAIFGAFVLATIILLFIKKIYYRLFKKQRYYIFPKMSVKGITNVAMVISISIASILLLTILSAGFMAVIFRAYPGWRSTIEGVLIKIGGLLFGPIIGLFIGAFTDLLTVGITAGMFHYGYFIVAMAYGYFSGLIRTIITLSRKKELSFLSLSSLFMALVFSLLLCFIIFVNNLDVYTIGLFGVDITFRKETLEIIFSCVFVIGFVSLWMLALTLDFWKIAYSFKKFIYDVKYIAPIEKYKHKLMRKHNSQAVADKHIDWVCKTEKKRQLALNDLNKISKKIDFDKITVWFHYFAPVLVTVITCEAIVEVLIMPVFDLDFSTLPYDYWFAFRLLMLCFMTPINIIIIFPIYRIVSPSMKYDYNKDIVESIYIPIHID